MKSNLNRFIENGEIQSSVDYFKSSKKSLHKLIDEQSVHEHRALKCIIEIGKTLSALQDYKRRIKSPKVDGLWTDLLKEVGISPATVTKYIKYPVTPYFPIIDSLVVFQQVSSHCMNSQNLNLSLCNFLLRVTR